MTDSTWFTAQELAGLPGFPASDRGIRIKAKKEKWESRPKDEGKGFEYHISSFPPAIQAALLRKAGKVVVGGMTLDLPKDEPQLRYCKEAVWDRWNKANTKAKEKAKTKVAALQAVMALHRLGDVWERLYPAERHRIVNLMVERVDLVPGGLKVSWRELGWKALIGEFAPDSIGAELVEMEVQ